MTIESLSLRIVTKNATFLVYKKVSRKGFTFGVRRLNLTVKTLFLWFYSDCIFMTKGQLQTAFIYHLRYIRCLLLFDDRSVCSTNGCSLNERTESLDEYPVASIIINCSLDFRRKPLHNDTCTRISISGKGNVL